ncbi:helix-turn-helix domain-containing protein [Enterococcus sp. 669A]|uniref:Helix-turn-helix domain-containing protein n=1 Tax=Candidatus Enterococcus moelleringii TaxID=2815325 RepID=A0ABS3LAS9_9ENTE|nr:helix-turn-helix domain-containing protein [Enterococcus sp. 669A]MBO1306722.1 helix-turn-helix domain-containing protein [Enterococcus sp. 669A]
MLSIFLNEEARKKIAILEAITHLDSGTYSVAYLSSLTNLSKRTINSYLPKINRDVAELYSFKLLDEESRITWIRKQVNISEYRLYLARKSLAYRFILYAFRYPENDFADFCTFSYVTTSSARRILTPLVDFFKRFDIKIRLSSMKFIGNEFEIRSLFYSAFWVISYGADIIENENDLSEEIEVLEKIGVLTCPSINTDEVLLTLLIAKKRMAANYPMPFFPLDNLPFSENDRQYLGKYIGQYVTDQQQAQQEFYGLLYAIFHSNFVIEPDDLRTEKMMDYFEVLAKEKSALAKLVKQCLTHLGPKLVDKKSPVQSANILIVLLKFFPMERVIFNISEFKVRSQDMLPARGAAVKRITAFVNKITRQMELEWVEDCSDSLILYLNYVVTPFLKQHERKLKVGIAPMPNYPLQVEIIEFLAELSFVEYSFAKNAASEVDLYISTFVNHLPEQTKPSILIDLKGLSTETKTGMFKLLYEEYQKIKRTPLAKNS